MHSHHLLQHRNPILLLRHHGTIFCCTGITFCCTDTIICCTGTIICCTDSYCCTSTMCSEIQNLFHLASLAVGGLWEQRNWRAMGRIFGTVAAIPQTATRD